MQCSLCRLPVQYAAVRKIQHTSVLFLLVNTFSSEFEVALHVKDYLFSKLYSKFYFFVEGNGNEGMLECMLLCLCNTR
jgi:hypothetical protein